MQLLHSACDLEITNGHKETITRKKKPRNALSGEMYRQVHLQSI